MARSEQITAKMDIVEGLRDAKRVMYENQKRHAELRRTYLEEIAEAALLQ
jgi:hypothetical protein